MNSESEQVTIAAETLFLPHQSYLGWKVVITLFHSLGIGSTVYRLVHRYRIRRLWQDDYILFAALVLDLVHWPLFWARSASVAGSSEAFIRKQQILNSYWLTILPLYSVLSITRVSVALSFVRIFPPRHPARKWSFTLIWLLLFNFIATLLATSLTCKSGSGLLVAAEMRNCIHFPNGVPLKNIVVLASDVTSDLSLIITPLYFFWRIKLPAQERRLVLIFFCGSFLTLLSAISYAAIANSQGVIGKKDWPLVNYGLGGIECSMSFLGCNSVVICTCFYQAIRRFRGRERPEIESTLETPRVSPTQECTCAIGDHLTAISLTEISGHSYNFERQSHVNSLNTFTRDRRNTDASSSNFRNQTSSLSGSEQGSEYTTSQNSDSQYTASLSGTQSAESASSLSQSSQSIPVPDSQRSTRSELDSRISRSTSESYVPSNYSIQ